MGNNKVSTITDALTVGIKRSNALEKYIRPSFKISVKENDLTPATTLTSPETKISTAL